MQEELVEALVEQDLRVPPTKQILGFELMTDYRNLYFPSRIRASTGAWSMPSSLSDLVWLMLERRTHPGSNIELCSNIWVVSLRNC
ncbi:hypothetical protein GOP47_0010136 [Adiantum capillus-veneris]|uniref:Uncharacterized protein n=1 Tax=Adiantum capillus-veneris TaxID=13818 RepID=A0A9D4UU67_ADICA|nr:hypothetical protein GOP47_0010136 [Adiantum capillus-veneris]